MVSCVTYTSVVYVCYTLFDVHVHYYCGFMKWGHTFMSVFISFAAAVGGQFHRDDAALSPVLTQQRVSICSQKTTKLQAPPTLVPPKSDKSSPTAAGDHTTPIR